MLDRYFDNAATSPVDPRVLREMLPYLTDDLGNANSIHSFGRKAMAAVELARTRIADLIEADDPSQIVFTSGASEANNWVIRSFPTVAISPFEHSSVLEPARDACGLILDPVLSTDPGHVALLCVMVVNNETGTVFEPESFRMKAERLHSDATQALGKIPFRVGGIDFAAFSAHKLYGPKGIGALYCGSEVPSPLIRGGEQEHGARAGTLNVPGIVGFGAAAEIAASEMSDDSRKALELRATVLEELSQVSDWKVNGGADVSPFILSVSFLGLEGETLVVECDKSGYAISAGAACSSRSTEPSHVLLALGLEEPWRRGTVRISFGRFNNPESASGLGRTLKHTVEKLRTMSLGRDFPRNVERVHERL